MKTAEYELIRSRRRTLSLEIRGGRVLVRAPLLMTKSKIDSFVSSHADWIEKKTVQSVNNKKLSEELGRLPADEIGTLREKAKAYIPGRVKIYAERIGVTYGSISIRCQRTRWGSCSAKGNLNFNCLLMLTPPEVIDSIVVHELCHRKHMDHGKHFYAEVYKAFPDYDSCRKWLRKNGQMIMSRVQ